MQDQATTISTITKREDQDRRRMNMEDEATTISTITNNSFVQFGLQVMS